MDLRKMINSNRERMPWTKLWLPTHKIDVDYHNSQCDYFWMGLWRGNQVLDGEITKVKPSWWWTFVKRDTKRLASLYPLCEGKECSHLHAREEPSQKNWTEAESPMFLDSPGSRTERKKSCSLSYLLHGILLSHKHTNRNESGKIMH